MTINEWDEYADSWDANPQTHHYAAKAFDELQKTLQLKGLRIFDFGCGTGLLSEKMSPVATEIIALDASEKMVEVLSRKKLANVQTVCGFLTQQLVETEDCFKHKFDLIVASSVCAFLPDYGTTLALLKNMLTPNGVIVQWDWLVSEEKESSGFSINELQSVLTHTGFHDFKLTTPFAIEDMNVLMAVMKNTKPY